MVPKSLRLNSVLDYSIILWLTNPTLYMLFSLQPQTCGGYICVSNFQKFQKKQHSHLSYMMCTQGKLSWTKYFFIKVGILGFFERPVPLTHQFIARVGKGSFSKTSGHYLQAVRACCGGIVSSIQHRIQMSTVKGKLDITVALWLMWEIPLFSHLRRGLYQRLWTYFYCFDIFVEKLDRVLCNAL